MFAISEEFQVRSCDDQGHTSLRWELERAELVGGWQWAEP